MSKLLTMLVAIAFAAAASMPVAQAADKGDTKSAPMEKKGKAEKKKGDTKKAAPKGDGKKTKGEGKKKAEAPK